MTSAPERQDLLEAVTELAERAGRAILEIYNDQYEIERKADKSPLTTADLTAHEIIDQGLRTLSPELPVLSEESGEIPYAERSGWRRYWLVDPLDGTREFIKRNGEFTVNVALIEDGVPVLGVVHAPVIAVTYFAAREAGAFKRVDGQPAESIHVSALPDAGPIRVAGSRSHSDERLSAYLERLGEHELRPMGSSLKSCLVAEGTADLYPRLGPTSEWDTAAAQAVVEAAGGHVTDVEGRPLRYNQGESLLNPEFLVFGDPGRDWTAYL